jgi:ubiquitin-like-conjugating enzyme ATG3
MCSVSLPVLIGEDDAKEAAKSATSKVPAAAAPAPADDEYADMDDYEDDSLALDDAAVASGSGGLKGTGNDDVLTARRYDVSITYDNYYRTPRVFLFGYDESGSPLAAERIFDDIMQDYANRTVTIENHPHTTRPQASIHPCQHGAAMKRVIEALNDVDRVPSVDQYLFIFLKFLQSVIPTIEYDYTVGANFGGGAAAEGK